MANDYDMTARNFMLDQLATLALRVALHSGDPGAANLATNELTGGSPAYARKAVVWAAAGTPTAGAIDDTTAPVFDVAAGSTVAWISGWNVAGTVRYYKKAVTSEVFAGQGTYTLTDLDLDLNNV